VVWLLKADQVIQGFQNKDDERWYAQSYCAPKTKVILEHRISILFYHNGKNGVKGVIEETPTRTGEKYQFPRILHIVGAVIDKRLMKSNKMMWFTRVPG